MIQNWQTLFRCPTTGLPLEFWGYREGMRLVGVARALDGPFWPTTDGFLKFYQDESIAGTDRLLGYIYDGLPRWHEPANRYLLPILQGKSEAATRAGYWPRLQLEQLSAKAGRPARILEIGIGSGNNLDTLTQRLPPSLPVHIVGVDLSVGMLRLCRKAHGHRDDLHVALADAHHLPFADNTFDRVFHIGAMGSYRDPAQALKEMVRVARPNTPIVVVDEQLDAEQRHSLYYRAAFRLLTFYDSDPKSPRADLPDNVTDIEETQISRFYYCLSFRKRR